MKLTRSPLRPEIQSHVRENGYRHSKKMAETTIPNLSLSLVQRLKIERSIEHRTTSMQGSTAQLLILFKLTSGLTRAGREAEILFERWTTDHLNFAAKVEIRDSERISAQFEGEGSCQKQKYTEQRLDGYSVAPPDAILDAHLIHKILKNSSKILAALICRGENFETVFFDVFCPPEFRSEVRFARKNRDREIRNLWTLFVRDCTKILFGIPLAKSKGPYIFDV
ncbi:hypothetical protein BD779DRAFT_1782862 [Infundibulicybe gibba]|nr:hypothetical protein BD779DRAFT_1782862 [Infundibulicybe gibba]